MIRLHTDDLIPRLQDADGIAHLENFAQNNYTSEEVVQDALCWANPQHPTWDQIMQLIADWVASGHSTTLSVEGDSLPQGVPRAAAPSGLGYNPANGAVWFGSYGGQQWDQSPKTGTFRFYANGVLKQTLTDYNYAEGLGVVTGDIVQICQVVEGVVGWWARIQVP